LSEQVKQVILQGVQVPVSFSN